MSLRILFGMTVVVAALPVSAGTQSYTVEDINDPYLRQYPVPAPVHVCTYSFNATSNRHEEIIPIDSKTVRNLSVTVANMGSGTVHAPYLFGPPGWVFRNLRALARQLTRDAVTSREKFFRIFEWQSKHLYRTAGDIKGNRYYGASYTLFLLNKHGQALCSATAAANCALL